MLFFNWKSGFCKKSNRASSRNVTSQKHKQKFVCGDHFNLATYHTCLVHWKGGSCMQRCDKQSVIKDGRVLVGSSAWLVLISIWRTQGKHMLC